MNKVLKIIIASLIIAGIPAVFGRAQLSGAQSNSEPEVINTLDYFVSHHLDKGLSGSHNQNQTVVGNTSYYTKWSNLAYEVHAWDDAYIYLKEDRSWKKDESYAFSPGKWMKRQMKIGESINESTNMGYYVNSNDCSPLRINSLPYVMTLESHEPHYNISGDLGSQDVIVLKYDYSNATYPGNYERYYYSKEWGWIKWELYENNNLIQESIFNKIHSDVIQPDLSRSCTKGGTVLPEGSNVAGPALKIRLNQAVQLGGTNHMYYITPRAERQYICNTQVLKRYASAGSSVDVIAQDELRLYPVVQYVRFSVDNSVYKVIGPAIRRMNSSAIKKAGLDAGSLTVFNLQDFSCYQVGNAID